MLILKICFENFLVSTLTPDPFEMLDKVNEIGVKQSAFFISDSTYVYEGRVK